MKNCSDLYRFERFTSERLIQLQHDISGYAVAINGLPKSHDQVFEKRGWLLPFLFGYDDLLWGRWSYWTEILMKGKIEGSGAIPRIEWVDLRTPTAIKTSKMLAACMDPNEATIDNFADWLLWGLGAIQELPRVSERLNEHYYRKFDIFLILDNPTDYLSYLLCEQTGKGYKAGLGYYPTPFNITRMMVDIAHGDCDPEILKRKTVMDPCVGCGAMLLPASNYFLRGYGQDISGIAVKLCMIQMYFYAPWYARPGDVVDFDQSPSIPLMLETLNGMGDEGQFAFQF